VGNYWLDLIEISEIADRLGEFILANVRGKRLANPDESVRRIVQDFYSKYPEYVKYQLRLNVECLASPFNDGNGYGVTDIRVVILT
jgi:hypothetical protein